MSLTQEGCTGKQTIATLGQPVAVGWRLGLMAVVLALTSCGGGEDAGPDLIVTQTPQALLSALPAQSTQALLWSRTVTVPNGTDLGAAMGTLFSLDDANGVPLAAAGLLHGVQSGVSLPNRQVSFFLGHNDDVASSFSQSQAGMPKPYGPADLFYMTAYRDTLLAFRYHRPGQVRAWQANTRTWVDFNDPAIPHDSVYPVRNVQTVANHLLVTYDQRVLWGGRPLNLRSPVFADARLFYLSGYANGRLRLAVVRKDSSDPAAPVVSAGLIDCEWTPPSRDVNACHYAEMPTHNGSKSIDHLLFGMHAIADGPVAAYGLNGDFLSWDGQAWVWVRKPERQASWQVYAAADIGDRVLMGHFPSGGVLSMQADSSKNLQWVVATTAVSSDAAVRRDEVQSLVPFGGDVLVGVWPWGELYRGHPSRGWSRFIQAFNRDARQPDAGHPYDELGMNNCLGQRIFQILPWGRGFVYSTTMKNNDTECAGAISRLSPDQQAEYGRVMFVERTNALTCNLVWTPGAAMLTFGVTKDHHMVVNQDGRELCSAPFSSPDLLARLIQWPAGAGGSAAAGSSGLFGPMRR